MHFRRIYTYRRKLNHTHTKYIIHAHVKSSIFHCNLNANKTKQNRTNPYTHNACSVNRDKFLYEKYIYIYQKLGSKNRKKVFLFDLMEMNSDRSFSPTSQLTKMNVILCFFCVWIFSHDAMHVTSKIKKVCSFTITHESIYIYIYRIVSKSSELNQFDTETPSNCFAFMQKWNKTSAVRKPFRMKNKKIIWTWKKNNLMSISFIYKYTLTHSIS